MSLYTRVFCYAYFILRFSHLLFLLLLLSFASVTCVCGSVCSHGVQMPVGVYVPVWLCVRMCLYADLCVMCDSCVCVFMCVIVYADVNASLSERVPSYQYILINKQLI